MIYKVPYTGKHIDLSRILVINEPICRHDYGEDYHYLISIEAQLMDKPIELWVLPIRDEERHVNINGGPLYKYSFPGGHMSHDINGSLYHLRVLDVFNRLLQAWSDCKRKE